MKTADMPVSLRQATHADIPLLIKARFDFLRALGYPIIAEELPEASLLIESFLSEHLNRDIFAWIGLEGETIAAEGFAGLSGHGQPKAPGDGSDASSTSSPGRNTAGRA